MIPKILGASAVILFTSIAHANISNQNVRFSIHEHHASYLSDLDTEGSHTSQLPVFSSILKHVSSETGLQFVPVWRHGDSSGEHELENGLVDFIIDPPQELGQRFPKEQQTAPIYKGHAVILRSALKNLENSTSENNQRIGYLSGITDFQKMGEAFKESKWIDLESFKEIHQKIIHQEIDAAVIPLRIAQDHLMTGLTEQLILERLFTSQPLQYIWIFHPEKIHLKNLIEEKIYQWPDTELQNFAGKNSKLELMMSYFQILEVWFVPFIALFVLLLIALLTGTWYWRIEKLKNSQREDSLNESKARALQASEAKSNFLATVSHEIRTPMHAVLGVQELLLRSKDLKNEERSLLLSAQHAANSLLEILNQVLDFSKMEAGKVESKLKPTNLRHLINAMLTPFAVLAKQQNIQCIFSADPALADSLFLDELRIRQVMQNLLSNAVKFTSNGCVRVACKVLSDTHAEQWLELSVADTGIGIASSEIERLLKPYEQSHIDQTNNLQGTGLGLSISAGLLKSMSSELLIDSQHGMGTTVSFLLRLKRSSAKPEYLFDKKSNNNWGNAKVNVFKGQALIVDDHRASRELLQLQLHQLGFTTVSACDAQEAIKIIDHSNIGLVITDESMPGMSGRDLSRQLRIKDQEIVIIGLTADIFAQDSHMDYIDAGMNALLVKPVGLDELRTCISEIFPEEMTEPSLDNHGLDIVALVSFTGDDTDAQNEIIDALLKTQEDALKFLEKSSISMDIKVLKSIAHKIRGGAKLINATDIIESCHNIESSNSIQTELLEYLITAIKNNNSALREHLKKHRCKSS